MTDNEIIKALECCGSYCCNECAYFNDDLCIENMSKQAIDLINRQKAENAELQHKIASCNAEIERLQDRNNKCIYLSDNETTEFCVDSICPKFKTEEMIKTEAIKEFAEKLKEKATSTFYEEHKYIDTEDVDNLVKEMTEGGAE